MNHRFSPSACLILVLFAKVPLGAVETAPLARTLEGQTFAAKLLKVDADGTITFDDDGRQHTVPVAELIAWSNPAEPLRGAQVFTTDGSLLIGEAALIDDEDLVVLTALVGTVRLPLEIVRGVVFQPPANREQRDRLAAQVRSAEGDTDRLIFTNGDQLTGTVLGLEELKILLETDAGSTKIEVDKIAALVFNPTLLAPNDTHILRVLVGLRDGTLLAATSLSAAEDTMWAKLAGGVEIESDAPGEIVSLQTLGGQATYLSDMTEHRFRHVPYLDLSWPFHKDHNVLGGRLRAGGRLYNKGLGMHSAARLTYRLDGPYRRFEAELAIDEAAGFQGSVVFRVFTSAGQTWQEVYNSPVIRSDAKPVPMSVDLAGARAIALVVDFSERGDQQDHADWLDARLIR